MCRIILSVLFIIVFLSGSAFSVCIWEARDPTDTMDDPMVKDWCNNMTHITNMWYGLNLDWRADYWRSIWEADGDYCNPYNGLTRLLNAAWFMLVMQWHRDNDTLSQEVTRWWDDYILAKADDSYAYTCTTAYIARNYDGGDTYLSALKWLPAVVPKRSATLVHEAVHHDGPAHNYTLEGKDADDVYGWYNSYTYTVKFLIQAIDTFLRDGESDRLIIQEYDGNMCGFIPLLNYYSFNDSHRRALNVLYTRFVCTPSSGYLLSSMCEEAQEKLSEVLDHWFGAWYFLQWYDIHGYAGWRWPCEEVCNPDDYQWPDGKDACNEVINDANHSTNLHNRVECVIALNNLPDFPTFDDIREARENFEEKKQACTNVVSDEYLEEYCSELIENPNITSVDDLENSYMLDDAPNLVMPDYAFEECVSRFCQERYDPAWKTDARDACYEWDDPLGCLDELCGPLALAIDGKQSLYNYFEKLQCRRHYIEFVGNLHFYFDRLENMGKCEQEYTDCVNEEAYEEWKEARPDECTLDDFLEALYQLYALKHLEDIDYDTTYDDFMEEFPYAVLGECEAKKLLCEQTKEFNIEILSKFVAVSPFPKPETPFIQSTNYMDLVTKQYAEHIASGGDTLPGLTLEQAHKQITQPENLWSLSKAVGPEALFAVLGGTEKVFGCDAASYYKDNGADVQFPFELTPDQQLLVPQLIKHKETRERVESEEIHHLLKSIAQSDPELLFDLMWDVHYTQNIDDVNIVLDGLSTLGLECCE